MKHPRKTVCTRSLTVRTLGTAILCGALLAVTPAFADSGDPSARVARLAYLEGSVSIQSAGVDQWSQAESNYSVATGDRLYTDQDGRDELSLGDTSIRMWHGADLTMTNLTDQLTQLGLAQGTIRVRTSDSGSPEQVEIDTPNGAITVVQPGDIRIDSYDESGTQVTVNSGEVQLTGPNMSQDIGAGNSVRLTGTNPINLEALAMPGQDEFDSWSLERDRHMQDSRSAEYVSRDTPGYDDLDDYGNWDTNTDYGPVWYPTQVAADWVPYRTGHWVWAGPYGWTWVESEPWGYAPFHYGRWVNYRSRWGWVPGPVRVRPVWSPALVVFAGGSGFSAGGVGVTAWFPLGVGEPYVPWYHCSSDYIRRVNVTNINIVNIRNTTIVNNYNNFVRSSNNYSNVRNINYSYLNRSAGFSAVNAHAFATGQPVARNLTTLRPEQIRTAQVIAHPSIQPTHQSVVTRPVSRAIPVPVVRPTLLTRGGRQAQAVPGAQPVAVPYRPAPAGGTNQAGRPGMAQPRPGPANPGASNPSGLRPGAANGQPVAARPLTPTQPVARPTPPVASQPGNEQPGNGQSAGFNRPSAGQPGGGYVRPLQPGRGNYAPQPLVIHNEPPAPQPTFQRQQPGLRGDPGRPLEPQQRENLSAGRPAGRPVDQEAFPHQQQVQRPQQQQRPPATPQPRMATSQPRPAPQTRSTPAPRPSSGGDHGRH